LSSLSSSSALTSTPHYSSSSAGKRGRPSDGPADVDGARRAMAAALDVDVVVVVVLRHLSHSY